MQVSEQGLTFIGRYSKNCFVNITRGDVGQNLRVLRKVGKVEVTVD